MSKGILRKVLAGLGVLIFLFGVISSLNRSKVMGSVHINLLFNDIVMNEVPNFGVRKLECPEQIALNDSEIVTAVVCCSSKPVQKVTLQACGFDVEPSDPLEVTIPEGEDVMLSWRVTAREMGVHEVAIPLNYWDRKICYIWVVGSRWLKFREGRILSLICMLAGSLFMIPKQGMASILIDRKIRKVILSLSAFFLLAVLAVVTNELITVESDVISAFGFVGLTLLPATLWVIVWYTGTWLSNCEIIPTRNKAFLKKGCFILSLIFALVLLSSPVEEPTSITLGLGIFTAILFSFTGMLLLFPWLDPTWDDPWEAVSKGRKAMRIFLYLVASPMTVLMFLMVLMESLLVFF